MAYNRSRHPSFADGIAVARLRISRNRRFYGARYGSARLSRELFGYSELFSGESMEYVSAIVKIVGAGYIFGIGADVCRELGEGGIANGVAVAGHVEIFVITLPFLKKILDFGTELIG